MVLSFQEPETHFYVPIPYLALMAEGDECEMKPGMLSVLFSALHFG